MHSLPGTQCNFCLHDMKAVSWGPKPTQAGAEVVKPSSRLALVPQGPESTPVSR